MRIGRRLVTLLSAAALVCVALPSAAQAHPRGPDRGLRQVDHIVVIYEENHSFDNLFGGWAGVNGLARKPGHTPRHGRSATDGTPFCVPAAEGRQPHLAAAAGRPARHDAVDGTASTARFRNAAVPDRRLHRSRPTRPARPPGVFAANGVLKGTGPAGRLHP